MRSADGLGPGTQAARLAAQGVTRLLGVPRPDIRLLDVRVGSCLIRVSVRGTPLGFSACFVIL
jgi:hypothetical protein